MPRRRLTEAEKQQRKANRSEKKAFLKQVFRDYDAEKKIRSDKRKVKAFLSAFKVEPVLTVKPHKSVRKANKASRNNFVEALVGRSIQDVMNIPTNKFQIQSVGFSIIPSESDKEIMESGKLTLIEVLLPIYKRLVSSVNVKGVLCRIFINLIERRSVSSKLGQLLSFDEFYNLFLKLFYEDPTIVNTSWVITTAKNPNGGCGVAVEIPNFLKKRGIILVKNSDDLCGQRCLALSEALMTGSYDNMKNLIKPARESQWLKKAKEISAKIEVQGRMTFVDFDIWADMMQKRVVILGGAMQVMYESQNPYSERVYIFHDASQEHYHFIADINSATNDVERNYKWCVSCNKSFLRTTFQNHKCIETVCHLCKTEFPCAEEKEQHYVSTSWPQCGMCNVKCPGACCFEKHKAICKGFSIKCLKCGKRCKKYHFPEHQCGEIWCGACETYHFDEIHRCCIKTLSNFTIVDGKRVYKDWKQTIFAYDFESQFIGNNVHEVNLAIVMKLFSDEPPLRFNNIDEFVKFTLQQTNTTFIAHNAKSYDGWMVHKHLIKHTNKRPSKLILAGNKIMYMKVKSIRFIDSINHVAQALETFPKTFGLTELKKGFFPYKFNIPENQAYIGNIPDAKFYSPDQMCVEKREEFFKWYIPKELNTHGIKFYKPDHEKREEFFQWYENKTVVYDFQKELVEYCISDVKILKEAMEIYIKAAIETDGINPLQVSTIASDCMKVYRTNYMPEKSIGILKKDEYDFCKRGFFGGRTEVFKLYKKWTPEQVQNDVYGKYIDINSLYPTVQYFDELPCGIPRWSQPSEGCVTKEYLENNFGYHEVDILCPSMVIPLLPEKKNGKLLFDLAPKKKAVYTSVELLKAIEAGYTVEKTYKSLVFDKSADLFKSYVSNFLKLKVESSGYDGDDIDAYIEAYKNHCNVVLDKYNIKPNKGMKLLAKIRLNSLWGKFGQRDDMRSNEYLNPDKWFRLLNRHIKGELEIHNETLIDENCVYAQFTEKDSDHSSLLTTNVALAGFVTSQARLRLFKELFLLGDRVLYCDTDSIIYEYRKDGYNTTEGCMLGHWEAELKTPMIEFSALGPKSYAYKCVDSEEDSVKCKGVTLNFANSQKFNFDTLKGLVHGETKSISTSKMEFVKDKKKGEIRTVYDVEKILNFDRGNFKRVINDDFSTCARE